MKKKKNIKNSQCDFLGGLQFGDEGKGKVVDYLALHYAFIARCGGGCNAGHTVGGQVLHIIPSGIFNDKIMNLIGSGVVLDPSAFLKEFKTVEKLAYQVARRILISYEI